MIVNLVKGGNMNKEGPTLVFPKVVPTNVSHEEQRRKFLTKLGTKESLKTIQTNVCLVEMPKGAGPFVGNLTIMYDRSQLVSRQHD